MAGKKAIFIKGHWIIANCEGTRVPVKAKQTGKEKNSKGYKKSLKNYSLKFGVIFLSELED